MSITTGIAAGAAAVTKFMTSNAVTAVANGAAIATPILVGVNIYETKKVGDKVGAVQSEVGAVKRICLDVRETVYRTEGEILFNSAVNGMLPYEMDEEGQFTQTTDPQLLGAYNAAIMGQNYQMAQPPVHQAPAVQAPVQYQPAHMPAPAQQPVQQTVFVNTPESASTPTVEPAPAETVATTTPASVPVPVEDAAPPAWFQAYLKAQEAKEAEESKKIEEFKASMEVLKSELKAEVDKADNKKK